MKVAIDKLLEEAYSLEESEQLPDAFKVYQKLYRDHNDNYEVWKHFYFLIWLGIEDMSDQFQKEIGIRELLQVLYKEGKAKFSHIADFNFIAGYTVSIFPYEYGDYDSLELEGNQMLKKASELEPNNSIYKMVWLGCIANAGNKDYKKSVQVASQFVLEDYKGPGALNKYFRDVLYRVEK